MGAMPQARLQAQVPWGGGGLISFLVFAGLPPGVVFLAKFFVVAEVLIQIGGLPAFFLAVREFVSWGVYLSIWGGGVLRGRGPRVQLWE